MKRYFIFVFLSLMLCFTAGMSSSSKPPTPPKPPEIHHYEPPQTVNVQDTQSKAELGKKQQEVKDLQVQIETFKKNISNLEAQLQDEKISNGKLKSQLEETEQEKSKLVKQVQYLQKQVKDMQEQRDISTYKRFIMFLCGIIVILSIIAWQCWVRITTRVVHIEDHTKCPFCGWEHDPGETVCRHCNTKFPWN